MKRNLLCCVMLLGTCLMNAQPTPSGIENPGSKGLLPQVGDIAPAREGELPILSLSHVGFSTFIVNGYVDVEANLSFPMVEEVGCDYYTAQYRNHGATEWNTMMDGDYPWRIADRTVGITPDIYTTTDYRLRLHGGEYDGYVSNTVTAKPLSMYSRYTGWSESPSVEYCMVNVPVGDQFTVSASTYKSGNETHYSTEDGYFTYQWYRRNPNNGDTEFIPGARDRIYTPQVEDVGYQLVLEVGGDKEHCDFYLYHAFNGVVCIPVQAAVAYLGTDGFILSTDYVIPDPQKMFVRDMSWVEDAPEFDPSCITEVSPGQYAFRLPEEEYNYCVYELANPAFFLTFIYKNIWGDGEDWYREAQIMTDRYKGMLSVKPQLAGNLVPATIDVIGKNIDGEWMVVASGDVDEAKGGAVFEQDWENDTDTRIFYGDYFVKAKATATTLETYYPATVLWASASPVNISFDNSWEPVQVDINLLPMPDQLTGTGVIEGVVSKTLVSRLRVRAAELQTTIVVYLLDAKTGDIVAQAPTDADGRFRFENVPFGTYKVLPNIDGYTVSTPAEVTLTAENPIVSDVDYEVTDDEVIPVGIHAIATSGPAVQGVWSLSGIQSATRGLNIIRMSDGTMKKVIMK